MPGHTEDKITDEEFQGLLPPGITPTTRTPTAVRPPTVTSQAPVTGQGVPDDEFRQLMPFPIRGAGGEVFTPEVLEEFRGDLPEDLGTPATNPPTTVSLPGGLTIQISPEGKTLEKPITFPDVSWKGMDLGEGLTLAVTGEVRHKDVGFPIGNIDPETGEFSESLEVRGITALEKPLAVLDFILEPVRIMGRGFFGMAEADWEKVRAQHDELIKQRDAELDTVATDDERKEIFEKYLPQLREIDPARSEEWEKRYRELPFLKQLLYESPFWFAIGISGLSALSGIKALQTGAATGAIRPGVATAGRIALEATGLPTVERVTGFVIGKTVNATYNALMTASLRRNLRSWATSVGKEIPKETEDAFVKATLTNLSPRFLAKEAIKTLFKPTKGGFTPTEAGARVAEEAVAQSVRTSPLLLKVVEVKPPVKPVVAEIKLPVKPEVVPTPPTVPTPTVAPVVKPVVKVAPPEVKLPPKPPAPVQRKQELAQLLATPKAELPKGVSKIALRKELSEINAKLVPAERKLRQQIMAEVKNIGLSESQYRKIFSEKGGSRWLRQVSIERLSRVLESVRVTRPVSIGGKKVITTKTEELIQASKQDLIAQDILTEEAYRDILKALKLETDKYVGKESFISQLQGASILKELRNRAILAPLGELRFGKPTAIKNLTSQTYYSHVLGVKPLVEPLEMGKVSFDLAHRALSRAIDNKIVAVNKAWGVSAGEKLSARIAGRPTKGVAELRDLLDKFEEVPPGLTPSQTTMFNWFRNLNRTIINGENEVRRGLGMPEIAYREAYVRHIPDAMAEEILRGIHPLPPGLEYWSKRIVSKKIFNPMEMRRKLSDDLAKLYTKDLAEASKSMVYTGLKEIHLAQPLKAFTERMGALSEVMPAPTRKWVTDYVNQVIKGQQTDWDANLDRLVTESGIGRLINDVLRPYRLSLGTKPVTKLAQAVGRLTILAVLALPRPRLLRLMIRNVFQRTQDLALHNPIAVLKSFLRDPPELKALKAKSLFLKSYTGVEEWPAELMGRIGKVALAPYQFTAVLNADRSFSINYHDYLQFFTKRQYKDLGWASPKRTYKEASRFLYPEEEAIMLREAELGARITQYHYIGMGMPEIFRNKTLIPLTRLQSWWMNHIFMFHREAAYRFLYGETRWGGKLPWSKRVNYLTYLLLGGAILTSMGYGMSYLWKVLPHNLSPVGQFMAGLLTLASADSEWERQKGKREIFGSWKAMIPGPLAWDEFNQIWSGEKPLWTLFFYGTEEEGIPPRPPTWGIINRQPAIDLKAAKKDIMEAEKQLGQTIVAEMPEPYHYIDDDGNVKLYTPPEETFIYTTVDLGAAIRNATLKFEDKEITIEKGFSPLTLFYKEAEGMWGAYYYSLPSSQRIPFRESPDGAYIEAYLFFWGKLSVLRNANSPDIVRGWMRKYEIPDSAVSGLKQPRKREVTTDTEKAEAERQKKLRERELRLIQQAQK